MTKGLSVRKIPMTSAQRLIHQAAKRVARSEAHRDTMIRIDAHKAIQAEAVREWITAISDLAIAEAQGPQ